ncbi:MAG: DUF3786 domain-containing protein [Desulfobacterales bacterium]
MPRIDDYINARNLAVDRLSQESFEKIAGRSGFELAEGDSLHIPFLDRTYRVSYPQFDFTDQVDGEKEVPIQEQVLILHYLMADEIPDLSGQWVSYREIPGASFYYGAFIKRAVDPLKKVFGQNMAGFSRSAEKLKARKIENGDAGFEFRMLPAVPLQLILWEGDEEFPAEANILFDKTIGRMLSPEDVAWLAGMVVYRMIALSR